MSLDIIKSIATVVCLFFWIGCATANASVFFRWVIEKKSGSNIPLIGGLIGCVACLISPWQFIHPYWFVPIILDTSYLMLIIGIWRILK